MIAIDSTGTQLISLRTFLARAIKALVTYVHRHSIGSVFRPPCNWTKVPHEHAVYVLTCTLHLGHHLH